MSKASGSIDLKSLKVAGEGASKYITYINETDGILVHNSDELTSYAQLNSSGLNVVQGGDSIATFGSNVRIGKDNDTRIELNNYGMTAISSEGSPYFNVLASGASIRQESLLRPTGILFPYNTDSSKSYSWDLNNIAYPTGTWASDVAIGDEFCVLVSGTQTAIDSGTSPQERTVIQKKFTFTKKDTTGTSESQTIGVIRVQYNPSVGSGGRINVTIYNNNNLYYISYINVQLAIYYDLPAPYYAIGSNMALEGDPLAVAFGNGTIPSAYGISLGKFNINDTTDTYAFIIGNGTSDNSRSNAFAIDWNGYIYPNNQIMADWITSKGTNGDWYYEKYASGKIDAWGIVQKSSITYSASGNLYRSTDLTITIPSGIFSATPTFVETFIHSSNAVIVSVMATPVSSTSLTAQIWKVNSSSNACTFRFHCVYYPSDY